DKLGRLLLMASGAYRVLDPEGLDRIRLNGVFPVRIVAIRAPHLALVDRMVVLQAEGGLFIQMALITGLGVFLGIDYGGVFLGLCLGIGMEAAWPMTGLAGEILVIASLLRIVLVMAVRTDIRAGVPDWLRGLPFDRG
ncbi:MAG: hypothetical protein AAB393_14070, partial [Bacteroidota bacterium]